ncbi:MAG: phosphate ABC transporter permease PstA [Candidatus Nanopelagicales bacterium]
MSVTTQARPTPPPAPPPGPILTGTAHDDRPLERGFKVVLFACLAVGIIFLAVLLGYVLIQGWPRLDANLFTNQMSRLRPETAGGQAAILGTLWIAVLTTVMSVPVGVSAAVYLEEYADKTKWWNRSIEIIIQNLAAVPSVVYGILGLGLIVRAPLNLGPVILAGALVLTLLVLPVVIISSREAIRAVPPWLRDGSLALGATRLQTVRKVVLPAAIPGIATGSILALSRAIGEAAPIVIIGGAAFVTFNPTGLDSRFTTLPLQIYNLVSQPQEEFRTLAYALIIVLLVILLILNSLAIFIRNRYQHRW